MGNDGCLNTLSTHPKNCVEFSSSNRQCDFIHIDISGECNTREWIQYCAKYLHEKYEQKWKLQKTNHNAWMTFQKTQEKTSIKEKRSECIYVCVRATDLKSREEKGKCSKCIYVK